MKKKYASGVRVSAVKRWSLNKILQKSLSPKANEVRQNRINEEAGEAQVDTIVKFEASS